MKKMGLIIIILALLVFIASAQAFSVSMSGTNSNGELYSESATYQLADNTRLEQSTIDGNTDIKISGDGKNNIDIGSGDSHALISTTGEVTADVVSSGETVVGNVNTLGMDIPVAISPEGYSTTQGQVADGSGYNYVGGYYSGADWKTVRGVFGGTNNPHVNFKFIDDDYNRAEFGAASGSSALISSLQAKEWEAAAGKDLYGSMESWHVPVGVHGSFDAKDGYNTIQFRPVDAGGYRAYTHRWFDARGYTVEADIVLNANEKWAWGYAQPNNLDAEAGVIHEMGHVFGMEDVFTQEYGRKSAMYGTLAYGENNRYYLTTADKQGIWRTYNY